MLEQRTLPICYRIVRRQWMWPVIPLTNTPVQSGMCAQFRGANSVPPMPESCESGWQKVAWDLRRWFGDKVGKTGKKQCCYFQRSTETFLQKTPVLHFSGAKLHGYLLEKSPRN